MAFSRIKILYVNNEVASPLHSMHDFSEQVLYIDELNFGAINFTLFKEHLDDKMDLIHGR